MDQVLKYAILITLVVFVQNRLTGQSVESYDDLLQKYVDKSGNVNYKGFMSENARFQSYLDDLSSHPPKQNDTREEKLAYWINAYNAFTIKLIIDHYPVESITDLHPFFYIPGINTVWHEEFFQIGGEDFNLDRIEHAILRKEFNEPRIHFAINCASKSCPKLRNEAYEAEKIDDQLDEQTRDFLADASKNRISKDKLELSKIFSWFGGDFKESGGVRKFVDEHTDIRISKDAEVSYLSYDWTLNE